MAEGTWKELPNAFSKDMAKTGRHNAQFVHIGSNRIVVTGGITSQALKKVSGIFFTRKRERLIVDHFH